MTATADRRRELLAAASLLLPAAGVLVSRLVLDDVLPAELASHWSGTGAADATAATGALLAIALVLSGLPAVAGLVAAAVGRAPRLLLATLGLVAGLGASAWATSVGTTLAAGRAEGAELGGWLLALLGGMLFAVAPALIAPGTRRASRLAAGRLPLAAEETGAWSQTLTGPVFAVAAIATAAGAALSLATLAAAGATGPAIAMAVVLGVVALVLLSFSRLRVTADRRGLRVVTTALGIPLRRIPLDTIASAGTAQLRPSEWGGWGYRVMPGRSAVILHAGPGLVVTTDRSREFAISLDDPETPAALLETLRSRA
ncbi:hypothetical protein C5D25_15625 [Rathayibacter sp. AY1D7]|uniref:hypothetical protein n=1 Tax=unclassified Rathayibacter TaxID=2609250 RepID=UPI000CE88D88|nr:MULTISPECIES: hypothetical protein [unclassified Rathayibacter]PPG75947.1 hypothetical protein C5C52_15910 [Rathayibacter sp. AY1E5]PPH55891.1 hypothetical protein C5D25_15625 [Rathayibacter sp. AY1D7]